MAIISLVLCVLAIASFFFMTGGIFRLLVISVGGAAGLILAILSLIRSGRQSKSSMTAMVLASIVIVAVVAMGVLFAIVLINWRDV